MQSSFMSFMAAVIKGVITDCPSHQVRFCWHSITASTPHQILNFVWHIKRPQAILELFWKCVLLGWLQLGMATGRVRAGFFHTWTQPVGQDPWPGPAPFMVPGFFPRPGPAPAGPHGPPLEIGPNSWPNRGKKKKKKVQIYFFLHSSLDLFLPFKPAYSK